MLERLVNIGFGFGALVLANWLGWISFLKDGTPTSDAKTIVAGLVIMFLLSLVIDFVMTWLAARWSEKRDRRRLAPLSVSKLYLIGFLGAFGAAFGLLVATAGLMSLDLPED
jgi:hypothetical protein